MVDAVCRTQPEPAVLAQRFVNYVPPQDLAADSLYARLLNADSREQCETLAVQFIEGTAPFTPGQYLCSTEQLGSAAQRLPDVAPALDEWLAGLDHSMGELQRRLEALFGVNGCSGMQKLLTAPDYLDDIDRLWQTYFALLIVLGDERAWMASVTRMLVANNVLQYLFIPPVIEPVQPEEPPTTLVRRLRNASIVAPATIFPLPPAR